jgi:hypothetical protein
MPRACGPGETHAPVIIGGLRREGWWHEGLAGAGRRCGRSGRRDSAGGLLRRTVRWGSGFNPLGAPSAEDLEALRAGWWWRGGTRSALRPAGSCAAVGPQWVLHDHGTWSVNIADQVP